MTKSKHPKVFSYFLFMQEQRNTVPGWANKSNTELQALCDPLWRKLNREEKDKYKQMKKAYKEKEQKEYELGLSTALRSEAKTSVIVGYVETPSIVWISKMNEVEKVEKQLSNMTMVPLQEVKNGTVAACRFSEDGEVYRCQVLVVEDADMVTIRYMDFGNTETVDRKELCHLPSGLGKLAPMAVRVRLGGMVGVKNTENNRRKVEKKLNVENLEVSLDKEGFATFYTGGIVISFKASKTERKYSHSKDRLHQNVDEEANVVGDLHTSDVTEVLDDKVKPSDDGNSSDSKVEKVLIEDTTECMEKCASIVNSSNVSLNGEGEASVVQSTTASTELDSGMGHSLMTECFGSVKSHQNLYETMVSNNQGFGLDHSVSVDKDEKVVLGGIFKNNEDEQKSFAGDDEGKKKRAKNVGMGRVYWKNKGRLCPRVHLANKSRKKEVGNEKLKIQGGWKVGDEVVAQWDDGVWRIGFLHEITKDVALVVCKEGMVKATKVLLSQLRHATIPVEALNMFEEELLEEDDDETSSENVFSDSKGSIRDNDIKPENYSKELDDLLSLIPYIDIETLSSPSCSNLISSLIIVIPALSVDQLDILVKSIVEHGLLVPAALQSETFLFARVLVRMVMLTNSDMRGQVLNCLAVHADEMKMSLCGIEVLKILEEYI